MHTLRMVMLAMMVAIGVVISPILRIEGMCPTAHLVNIVCSVLMGPWYSLLCATMIGVIRMMFMGIPPLALTGAVFGAFLSGMLYRLSKGKLVCAFIGEVIGTGIIGAIVSYPVMTLIWGRTGLTWFFYVPSFIAGTLIGGSLAFIFLKHLQKYRPELKPKYVAISSIRSVGFSISNAVALLSLHSKMKLAGVVPVMSFIFSKKALRPIHTSDASCSILKSGFSIFFSTISFILSSSFLSLSF